MHPTYSLYLHKDKKDKHVNNFIAYSMYNGYNGFMSQITDLKKKTGWSR